jgi:hypothetical protein
VRYCRYSVLQTRVQDCLIVVRSRAVALPLLAIRRRVEFIEGKKYAMLSTCSAACDQQESPTVMISNSMFVMSDTWHSRLLEACSVLRAQYLPPGNSGTGRRHAADNRFGICRATPATQMTCPALCSISFIMVFSLLSSRLQDHLLQCVGHR